MDASRPQSGSTFKRVAGAALAPFRPVIDWAAWSVGGRRGAPPHFVKRRVVLEHARRHSLRTLVETGTYRGDMVEAMRREFDRVISIELSAPLAAAARERFRNAANVTIEQGDSGTVLPRILASLEGPALFWLDGHWSGGETARGERDTPVLAELEHLFADPRPGHVVLVDDARLFDGIAGYPTIENLKDLVRRRRPEWRVSVADDVIRLEPPGATRHAHELLNIVIINN